jgi:protein-ribulosamine 3-kinase
VIQKDILNIIISYFSASEVQSCEKLSGGSINEVYTLRIENVDYCLKVNQNLAYKDFFTKEANGLDELRKAPHIKVPKIYTFSDETNASYLLIEFIHNKIPTNSDWEHAAIALAEMHKITSTEFGFYEDNFIGSQVQENQKMTSWTDFYRQERLENQFQIAVSKSSFSKQEIKNFLRFLDKLDQLIVSESPSLLHGDLWSGNYFFSEDSEFVLIDPAVYYGNREIDLAMSRLFGSASSVFYDSYHKYFPLEAEWKERVKIYQLYPILVHINLFGSSYISQYRSIINHFL